MAETAQARGAHVAPHARATAAAPPSDSGTSLSGSTGRDAGVAGPTQAHPRGGDLHGKSGARGSCQPGLVEDGDPHAPPKPLLRGVSHQHACFAALSAGAMLVLSAPSPRAKVVCAVYAATLTVLFGVSATYHRRSWDPKARAFMRRLDHSSIFLLIAGTYTPLCTLALQEPLGPRLLTLVWGAALVGICQKLIWIHAPKWVATAIYIALGWAVVPHAGEVVRVLGPVCGGLLLAGGLSYSVGGLIYAAKYPDPIPEVFGYHEIFHALVVLASIFHFASVYMVVHGILPAARLAQA